MRRPIDETIVTPGSLISRGFGQRIITRGLGPSINHLVTQGYGGKPEFVTATFKRSLFVGQSGLKRRLRELDVIVVWAKLIELNDRSPAKDVEGATNVRHDKGSKVVAIVAEHVSSIVGKLSSNIKVIAKRIK